MRRPAKAHWRHHEAPDGDHPGSFACAEHGRYCYRVWVRAEGARDGHGPLTLLEVPPEEVRDLHGQLVPHAPEPEPQLLEVEQMRLEPVVAVVEGRVVPQAQPTGMGAGAGTGTVEPERRPERERERPRPAGASQRLAPPVQGGPGWAWARRLRKRWSGRQRPRWLR